MIRRSVLKTLAVPIILVSYLAGYADIEQFFPARVVHACGAMNSAQCRCNRTDFSSHGDPVCATPGCRLASNCCCSRSLPPTLSLNRDSEPVIPVTITEHSSCITEYTRLVIGHPSAPFVRSLIKPPNA